MGGTTGEVHWGSRSVYINKESEVLIIVLECKTIWILFSSQNAFISMALILCHLLSLEVFSRSHVHFHLLSCGIVKDLIGIFIGLHV